MPTLKRRNMANAEHRKKVSRQKMKLQVQQNNHLHHIEGCSSGSLNTRLPVTQTEIDQESPQLCEETTKVLKGEGFDFWKNTLNSCRYVVAPMVDQSELAWRMLSRRYGAELCFTPMFHSSVFAKDPHYRRESLQSCEGDRPLIVQFCGNDPDTVLAAAKLAEDHCDAIDLNLGCPQMIARRGHYGAYLQDEWELLEKIVSTCHANLKVPITCKIRVFESIEKTVEYAKMLEKAGCQLLTVHGRTREMKGRLTGLANWEYVKAIKKAINIPVFSNGNIQYLADVERCLKETGVDGVMSAEGNLHNPALFAGINPPIWQMCEEYLELTEKYPCPLSYIRGHVFKILHHGLHLHPDVRDMVGVAKSPECLKTAVQVLKQRCLKEMADDDFDPHAGLFGKLPLPYWYCQPYERPSPEQEEQNRQKRELLTRPATIEVLVLEKGMSKKKVKKRLRNPNKNFDAKKKVKFEICADIQCNNPRGQKCNFNMCKGCCRKKTSAEVVDCIGHKIHFTTHPLVQQRNKKNSLISEKITEDTNKEHSGDSSSGSNNTTTDSGSGSNNTTTDSGSGSNNTTTDSGSGSNNTTTDSGSGSNNTTTDSGSGSNNTTTDSGSGSNNTTTDSGSGSNNTTTDSGSGSNNTTTDSGSGSNNTTTDSGSGSNNTTTNSGSGSNNSTTNSGVSKDLETCSSGTRCDTTTSMETTI